MPKLPWVKWSPSDWASEPGLRVCCAATRGIWFELVNTMLLTESHFVSGTAEELSRIAFCKIPEMQTAVVELLQFGVAIVDIKSMAVEGDQPSDYIQNTNIIITNRRLLRQFEISNLRRDAVNKRYTKNLQAPLHTSASASYSPSEVGGVGEGELPEIPSNLNTSDFKSTWSEWIEYRKRRAKVRDSHSLFTRQLAWLIQYGPEVAVEILKASMRNEWQGLFPPKGTHSPSPQRPRGPNI